MTGRPGLLAPAAPARLLLIARLANLTARWLFRKQTVRNRV
jgi:hypothetical protein